MNMSQRRIVSFLGTISGCLVAILVAIYWAMFVNQLVISARTSQPQQHWTDLARSDAYGLCYNGCGDACLYPGIIADACAKTAQVSIPFCDGHEIWFWADRYPDSCLEAVGQIYKNDAVGWIRFWFRGLYLLCFVFGFLAFWAAFYAVWLVGSLVVRYMEIRARRAAVRREESRVREPLLHPRTGVTAVVLLLAILATPIIAYPCPNYYPPYNKPFSNANGTIYGVIHGWLSDCYDETYECGKSCTTASTDGFVTCTPLFCTRAVPFMLPINFVEKAAWRVEECGFRFMDAVPGVVGRRIPNERIEGILWVKVSVNGFNRTWEGGEGLDDGVRCLYEMV